MMKTGQSVFDGGIGCIHAQRKGCFEALMFCVMEFKEPDEIQQVGWVESAVFERQQFSQVVIIVLQNELMRRHVHGLHQFVRFFYNGGTVAPGKHRGKKAGYFNVLQPGK